MSGIDRSRVTVIVPTYNRRESLRRCLEGILACDAAGLEVTVRVSDDGSTDGTAAVVEGLGARQAGPARLLYHRQENQGQSAARNLAIEASDTDLLVFTDDDCVPEPGWIRAMASASWEDGVGGMAGWLVASEAGNWVSRYCRHVRYNEYPPRGDLPRWANSANCAYLRRALLEVGGYERLLPRLVDQDLGRRLVESGFRIHYEPDAVVHHYHRESVRALARDYWKRGYTSILRNLLWGTELPITPERVRAERWTLVRRGVRDLLLLPLAAARLRRQGVAAGDALPFAFLDWVEWWMGRSGQISVMTRILSGEQRIERFSRASGESMPGEVAGCGSASKGCHPERSEGSDCTAEILHSVQDDKLDGLG